MMAEFLQKEKFKRPGQQLQYLPRPCLRNDTLSLLLYFIGPQVSLGSVCAGIQKHSYQETRITGECFGSWLPQKFQLFLLVKPLILLQFPFFVVVVDQHFMLSFFLISCMFFTPYKHVLLNILHCVRVLSDQKFIHSQHQA